MNLQKMGLTVGLALVVGALISLALPDDPEQVAEQLFNEVNFESQDLRLASERLIATRTRLLRNEGDLATQKVLQDEAQVLVVEMDQKLTQVVGWAQNFATPPSEDRIEWLGAQRTEVEGLLDEVRDLDRKGRVLLGDPGAN